MTLIKLVIRNVNNVIETDIYILQTCGQQTIYSIQFMSEQNIPFCLEEGVRTIISNDQVLKLRLQELETFLKVRGYPDSLIKNSKFK